MALSPAHPGPIPPGPVHHEVRLVADRGGERGGGSEGDGHEEGPRAGPELPGGDDGDGETAATGTSNIDCVLGTSKIGDCTI